MTKKWNEYKDARYGNNIGKYYSKGITDGCQVREENVPVILRFPRVSHMSGFPGQPKAGMQIFVSI